MSDYYYGQGRVSLAVREPGKPLNLRWVGDVDQLNVSFSTSSQQRKISNRGVIATMDKHITHQECQVSANFYQHSPDNLALALFGQTVTLKAKATQQIFPVGIVAGGRYPLEQVNVWDVTIRGLIEGIDFRVDSAWGVIEILKTPIIQPITVQYKYAGSDCVPLLTRPPIEVMLRYEGVNLAEDRGSVLVELYRVQFDATTALNLINNTTSLSSFELSGEVLLDTARNTHDLLGQYGRYVIGRPITDSSQGTLAPVLTTAAYGGEITTVYPK